MRLDVGRIGTKNLLHAIKCQLLGNVDKFATAVIAFAWIALGIFVGELRALCSHHGRRGIVFTGNELNVMFLTCIFCLDSGKNFGIGLFNQNIF